MTDAKEWKICGAKTRAGHPCKNAAMENGRCRMHGGSQPRGLASPNFKSGRYSKALPERLLQKYEALIEGAMLPSLEDEIALTMARVSELVGRIDSGEASAAWKQLTSAYDSMFAEPQKREEHLATILHVLSARRHDYHVWEDINGQVEQARRLVDSQNKLLAARQESYSSEQMLTVLTAVADSIRRNIQNDKRAIRAISRDLDQLAFRNPVRNAEP